MKEEYKWVQNFPPAVPLVGIVLGLVFVMLKSPNIVASDTVSTGIGLGFGMSIAAAIAFVIAWSSRRLAQTEARVQFASRWAWAILIASFIAQFANSGLSDAVQPPQTKTASHGNSLESQLLAVANEVTRSAPQIIDADTRLDGAVAGPGLSIHTCLASQMSLQLTSHRLYSIPTWHHSFGSPLAATASSRNSLTTLSRFTTHIAAATAGQLAPLQLVELHAHKYVA